MPSPQPGRPKGTPEPLTVPVEEINYIEIDFGPQLTPEQRKWPVVRLKGQRPLHELVPAHRLPPGYTHPDYKPAEPAPPPPADSPPKSD